MKKISLYIICALASVMTTVAQPRLVPENDILKVGEVIFQEAKTFHLPFTNKGNEELIIKAVHASCGCTKVDYPQGPIQPGARGEILMTYDAKMLGSFYKDIEILTNESDQPIYMAIQGYVVNQLTDFNIDYPIDLGNVRMEADYIEFDEVNKGDMPIAELRIVNMERTAFRPQIMHLPAYLSAEYEPETIAPGRVGKIRLTLDSEKMPTMGLTQTSIYLARYMGDKISSSNEIAVSAVLLPSYRDMNINNTENAPVLYITEPTVEMGSMGKKQKLSHDVMLLNMGKTPLNIKQIQVFSKALNLSLSDQVIEPGKSAKLRITVLKKFLKTEKNRPRVLIISDDPDHTKEIIEIDIEE